MEPQTIINQSYIQDSVANTADYTTILAIAPSMTGQDINGPGLSDGNVKNTLRGLPDGQFAMQYDGIPFGDTNGPSHHSESYFPGPTIGSISVDRGPGNAGNMGAATYGGTVKLFSETLLPDRGFTAMATGGSWGTNVENLNAQSGDFGVAGISTRALANIEFIGGTGYLTGQSTSRQNILLKTQSDLGNGWTLTLFGDYNGLYQHVNDNNGATPAQINAFGESFALQNTTSAKLGTYQPFSSQHKKTDLDYVRLEGDIGSLHVDDQAYTYAYVNKTISSTNVGQTAADIAAGMTQGLGTVVNGVTNKNDVPGYTKQNAYRVWGNFFRLSQDYDFGWLTGQVRAGIWWESQATQRSRFDYDLTQCFAANPICNPWRNGQAYADSSLVAKTKSQFYTFPEIGIFRLCRICRAQQLEPVPALHRSGSEAVRKSDPYARLQICGLVAQRRRAAGTEDGAGGAGQRFLHHHPRTAFLRGQLQDRAELERLCPICSGHLCAGHFIVRAGDAGRGFPQGGNHHQLPGRFGLL